MATRSFQVWVAVVRVLDAPSQTFGYLAEDPAIAPPYIVNTVLGAIAAAFSMPVTIGFMQTQLMEQGMPDGSFLTEWMLYGGVVGTLMGPLLSGFFIAAVVFGILWIGGHAVTFKSIFSIVGYARIPLSIGGLINAFLITRAANPAQVSQFSLSAAALATADTAPLVTGLLSTIAPFGLWYFVLIALGVAAVTRTTTQKIWWVAGLLYGLNLVMVMLGSGLSTATLQ